MTDRQLAAKRAKRLYAAGAVLVAAGVIGAAWTGAKHDSPPPCTAGASSVDRAGHVHTNWYPRGCRH